MAKHTHIVKRISPDIGWALSEEASISPISPNYTGSDCSGYDGDPNRTLTASATPRLIVVDNQTLHPTKDFTLSGNTITFLLKPG